MTPQVLPKAARIWASHRYRAWRESRDALACDAMVLSRAKSGRTWLRAMLSRLYQRHYDLPEAQLIEFDNFHRQRAEIPTIFFTHGHYLKERFASDAWLRRFGDRKLVFLARHPCDVAVSEYFQSTRRASRHKVQLHGIDVDAPIFDFVTRSPLGLPAIVDYLNAWAPLVKARDDAMIVRYEDLRAAPGEHLLRVVEFLGAPFSKEEVQEAVDFAAFENLKELERKDFFGSSRLKAKDPNDPDSFKVRRGKVGGWMDYFDDAEITSLAALVRERLTREYGYAG